MLHLIKVAIFLKSWRLYSLYSSTQLLQRHGIIFFEPFKIVNWYRAVFKSQQCFLLRYNYFAAGLQSQVKKEIVFWVGTAFETAKSDEFDRMYFNGI